jgi:hypothetical protein
MTSEKLHEDSEERIPVQTHTSAEEVEGAVRHFIGSMPSGEGRVDKLQSELASIFRNVPPEKQGELRQFLDGLKTIPYSDDEDFIRFATKALYAFANEHFAAEEFEDIVRSTFAERGGFTPLNEVLSYAVSGNNIHIHLASAKTESIGAKLGFIRSGLKELARRITAESALQNVEVISADSWIVAAHPAMLKGLGFTVDGPITDEEREAYFGGEEGDISKSHMNKNDFLKKYGQ